ncbi:MAG: L-seryl-tRNA(Sec) selenium transferase [Candidatus Eisenbacteria bacterium]|nr:L-seryl-tRNA(Sec) selenium transferase [Candidatus Eisenbacteria bacterium]
MARIVRRSNLRNLPAVEALLGHAALARALERLPRPVVVEAVRAELADARARLTREGGAAPDPAALAAQAARRAEQAARPQLRRVLNATGVVLHTNLGRAPLAEVARRAVSDVARGYSSLEFDLDSGRRGERGLGVERWLTLLTGAEAALAVNNGAGAVLLALSSLARGRGVIVSRGELVEIGGSFRIPEILEKSGARLIEVGTTNRTHLRDYERALKGDDVAAILRVHRSNFRLDGFTAQPDPRALSALARKRRVPFIEDLGSGALVDLAALGLAHEPTVTESLLAGADVVTCSGDKLLGGSQAGLLVGRRRWIEKLRKDPLARALRLDKLALAALEATLPLYADPLRAAREVPALAMLAIGEDALEVRARRLATALESRISALTVRLVRGPGEVGGGALPLHELPGWAVEVRHASLDANDLQRLARSAEPPVLGIIRGGAFRLDPRALSEAELDEATGALAAIWS